MTDTATKPQCAGCNRDLQGRLAHYGKCPLAPKVPDALLSEAEAAYDREDQEWFNRLSTENLVAMWALCITINAPSWDDEVYDALAARGHWDVEG